MQRKYSIRNIFARRNKLYPHVNKQFLFLLDGECGVSKYDDAARPPFGNVEIVGGKESRPNEFPHQVKQ